MLSSRRDDCVVDLEADRPPTSAKPKRARASARPSSSSLGDKDDNEEERSDRALLIHRCVYLSCPLACSFVVLCFGLRFLWLAYSKPHAAVPL